MRLGANDCELQVVRRIKEKVAAVAASTAALDQIDEITYTLPDRMPV